MNDGAPESMRIWFTSPEVHLKSLLRDPTTPRSFPTRVLHRGLTATLLYPKSHETQLLFFVVWFCLSLSDANLEGALPSLGF